MFQLSFHFAYHRCWLGEKRIIELWAQKKKNGPIFFPNFLKLTLSFSELRGSNRHLPKRFRLPYSEMGSLFFFFFFFFWAQPKCLK